MDIESFSHKALERLYLTGKAKGLNAQIVPRLARMFQFLTAIQSIEELHVPPNFGAHELKGDRIGLWSLTVTKNWRMTFRISDDLVITDIDLEDYH